MRKNFKIGVIKLDGYLEIKSRINHANNKFFYSINKNGQNNNDDKLISSSNTNNIDNIFITCNLIEDCC